MKANGHRVLSFSSTYRIRAVEAVDYADEIAAFDHACRAQLQPNGDWHHLANDDERLAA